MTHWRVIIVISLIVVIVAIWAMFSSTSFISTKFNSKPSKIILNVYVDSIVSDSLSVIWKGENIPPKQVFSSGNMTDGNLFSYGKNIFYIMYMSDTIGSFGHFKTNNWHSHEYYISIDCENSKITFKVDVKGRDKDSKWVVSDRENNCI